MPNHQPLRYYRQRVYLYDTGIVSDEEKDLIPTVEKCIVQFGCRVILIDNLMTAIDLFNEKGARRIYAFTEDYNIRSQKLCERLGMRKEGMFIEFGLEGVPDVPISKTYADSIKKWLMSSPENA